MCVVFVFIVLYRDGKERGKKKTGRYCVWKDTLTCAVYGLMLSLTCSTRAKKNKRQQLDTKAHNGADRKLPQQVHAWELVVELDRFVP